jgi:hypothetical protein
MPMQLLTVSLTPDFSPVLRKLTGFSRFNGFGRLLKPLKRLSVFASYCTWLKPGVNERWL